MVAVEFFECNESFGHWDASRVSYGKAEIQISKGMLYLFILRCLLIFGSYGWYAIVLCGVVKLRCCFD